MTTDAISNTQDIIDSRDIIARLKELEEAREESLDKLREYHEEKARVTDVDDDDDDAGPEELDTFEGTDKDATEYALTDDWDEDTEREYNDLKALDEEAGGSGDYGHGETLIRDDYFEDYARQLADDLGLMKDENAWPYTCIDWEMAADELKQDYTSVEFGDTTYWVRS
jgi:hypothetical protein